MNQMEKIVMEALGGGQKKSDEWDVTILPEAQIETLLEQFAVYRKNRFSPGDLVTPKKLSGTKGAGNPYVVVEILEDPPLIGMDKDPSHRAFGVRPDIRVLTFVENELVLPFWGESWEYEPYIRPVN